MTTYICLTDENKLILKEYIHEKELDTISIDNINIENMTGVKPLSDAEETMRIKLKFDIEKQFFYTEPMIEE